MLRKMEYVVTKDISIGVTCGLPGDLDSKRICLQCRKPGFNPWIGKIWRSKWQPNPAFLNGESHGKRRLAGYGPWVTKSGTHLSD